MKIPNMPKPFVIVSTALPDDWLKLITDKCDLIVGLEESEGISQDLIAQLDKTVGLFTLLMDPIEKKSSNPPQTSRL